LIALIINARPQESGVGYRVSGETPDS